MNQKALSIKRIYEHVAEADGYRILVDRLWPRGISKEVADVNEWWKEIAPSAELRKWFGHDPEKYNEFRLRYFEELDQSDYASECRDRVEGILQEKNVVLLYAAKDAEHNNAVVLKEWLER